MTIKKSDRWMSIFSLAISAVPIIWAFVVFYSNQNVLAENVRELQNEKQYIREKLDEIVVKLSNIDGQMNVRPSCKR